MHERMARELCVCVRAMYVNMTGKCSGAAIVGGLQSMLPEVASKSSPTVSSMPLKIPHKMAEPPDAASPKMHSSRGVESVQSKMSDLKVRTHARARAPTAAFGGRAVVVLWLQELIDRCTCVIVPCM